MGSFDPDDGLPLGDEVGSWAIEKHKYIKGYVNICRHVRSKFNRWSETTYVELYCGHGRARIKDTDNFIDGSALVAAKAAAEGDGPFSRILIADCDEQAVTTCGNRLRSAGFRVDEFWGKSHKTVYEAASSLHLKGFHFAFLDPFDLQLPFSVIKKLAAFKSMDIMVHFSDMDLTRNFDNYVKEPEPNRLDEFAPGWRRSYLSRQNKRNQRRAFLNYWVGLVKELGFGRSEAVAPVHGSRGQRLYHLTLLSKKQDLADKFWRAVLKSERPQREFEF